MKIKKSMYIVGLLLTVILVLVLTIHFSEDKENTDDIATFTQEPTTKEPVMLKTDTPKPVATETPVPTDQPVKRLINPMGTTLETRILVPEGYTRSSASSDSLTAFLRAYGLKEDGVPVLLYDGTLKANQEAHAAVFTLPIENCNLQQCADSIMRVYAEYYWQKKAYDKIAFHFTNGFLANYTKWQAGYRISVDGNNVYWVKSTSFDDSYECFQKYLQVVFCYAGTISMQGESTPIDKSDISVGDIFIKGGSPGHCVMVVDICENAVGKKAFLLAQGYMPAQEFHVLNNEAHRENPWYYEEEITYPLRTPQYAFEEGSLRRLEYH